MNILFACEVTDEYKEARKITFKESYNSYRLCNSAIQSAVYWENVVNCINTLKEGEPAYKCLEKVSFKLVELSKDKVKICDVLEPTSADLKKILSEYIKKNSLNKCKYKN